MSTWEGGPLLDYPSTCIRVPEQRGEMRMATLSVLKFNDPNGADRVLIALQGLQEREMITLEDAAVLSWPQGKKKPTTRQLHSTGGAGAMGGAFWGFLFGLIFFVPFLGATSGATAPDRVVDELRQYDFEIISTNLPEEQEQKLREAFAQE